MRFGAYTIEEFIGGGGMGVVYRARDTALDRSVALKLIAEQIASEPGYRERFLREARLGARIAHPNVIPIFSAGEDHGRLYMAMMLVDGTDLRHVIDQRNGVSISEITQLLTQVASGLDAVHELGLVHRDVKPENVLVTRGGPATPRHAYLADFGLARPSATAGPTQTGQMLGTLSYASPELLRGEPVSARSDVYALACVLFECLTGQRPFVRENEVALLYAQLEAPRPRVTDVRPDLDPALNAVVARGMAIESSDRFGSAGELMSEASHALGVGIRPAPSRHPRSASVTQVTPTRATPGAESKEPADGSMSEAITRPRLSNDEGPGGPISMAEERVVPTSEGTSAGESGDLDIGAERPPSGEVSGRHAEDATAQVSPAVPANTGTGRQPERRRRTTLLVGTSVLIVIALVALVAAFRTASTSSPGDLLVAPTTGPSTTAPGSVPPGPSSSVPFVPEDGPPAAWVAVGGGGSVLVSDEGSRWVDITAGLASVNGRSRISSLTAVSIGARSMVVGGIVLADSDRVAQDPIMAVGHGSGGSAGSSRVSALDWTSVTDPPDEVVSVANNGTGQWMSVGPGSIATSTDGEHWTPVLGHLAKGGLRDLSNARDGALPFLKHVDFGPKGPVIVGDQDNRGLVLVPKGDSQWTTVFPPGAGALRSVTHSPGLWVAVGIGTVVTSENGETWERQAPSGNLNGVATDGSQYVAVGADGVILGSTDARSWMKRDSTTTVGLASVATCRGLWIAVGSAGTVLVSVDTNTWTKVDAGTSADLLGVSCR